MYARESDITSLPVINVWRQLSINNHESYCNCITIAIVIVSEKGFCFIFRTAERTFPIVEYKFPTAECTFRSGEYKQDTLYLQIQDGFI